jgi:hypothetical protein
MGQAKVSDEHGNKYIVTREKEGYVAEPTN